MSEQQRGDHFVIDDSFPSEVDRAAVLETWQRANVVRIAHAWIRTPYVHQGRIKDLAADCTFLAMVYIEAGLMPASLLEEIPKYSPQAHLNRSAAAYMSIVARHAKREVPEADARDGDLVMFHVARTWSHGGVVDGPGWPRIIHASLSARAVIEGEGDQGDLAGRERRFFSLW